jgi:MFS family permease
MNLCISAPILLSVPAGWLMDRLGFQPVFMAVTVLLVVGWLCTFALSEPRKRVDLPARPALPSLDSETVV